MWRKKLDSMVSNLPFILALTGVLGDSKYKITSTKSLVGVGVVSFKNVRLKRKEKCFQIR